MNSLDILYQSGILIDNEVWFVNENPLKVQWAKDIYQGDENDKFIVQNWLNWKTDMKFDVIVGNPPYNAAQENDGRRGGGTTLWDRFVEKSFSILKPNGFLCYVHPCGWRAPEGRFQETKEKLVSKQIVYLEMHDAKDGIDTFGVGVRYDWYVLQNKTNVEPTLILGEDGKSVKHQLLDMPFIPNGMFNEIEKLIAKSGEETVEVLYSRSAYGSDKLHMSSEKKGKSVKHQLLDMPFIPNGMFDEIMSLVAKPGEETVEVLHSYSAYESRKPHMSSEKKGKFVYPVIHSIKKNGLNCIYSTTDKNGMFGVPKVVFGCGQSETFIDYKGEYGLSQHTRAIICKPEELELINKALNSEKFLKISSYCCLISTGMFIDRYNKDVLALFKKDFWKHFVDENGNELP